MGIREGATGFFEKAVLGSARKCKIPCAGALYNAGTILSCLAEPFEFSEKLQLLARRILCQGPSPATALPAVPVELEKKPAEAEAPVSQHKVAAL